MPSDRVASVNSISRERRRAEASSARVPINAASRSPSSRIVSGTVPRTNARSQTFRNSMVSAVGGSCSGLKPVGTPFRSGR